MHSIILRALLCASLGLAGPAGAQTAFSYKGRLVDGGQAAQGLYDFQFNLADAATNGNWIGTTGMENAATNGNIVGATLTQIGVAVSNGIFAVTLDFGSGAFDGSPRWLQVGVRTNGAAGSFTALFPRQAITAVPYATLATSALRAGIASNLVAGATWYGNGSGLTNLNGANIQAGSITQAQVDPATDEAYRAVNTNAVEALGDARWASRAGVLGPVVNVKDYGAVGDGATDDTGAIANAWNAFSSGGGTLFFPPGVYIDSGSHVLSGFTFTQGDVIYHDGRAVLGLGKVIWSYTGSGTFLLFTNGAPDVEGIEFLGNYSAKAALYVTTPQNKWTMKNCFFRNWYNTAVGALVMDEVDGVTIYSSYFYDCNIGAGLGYRCNTLKADLELYNCGIGVAVGVPTSSFPSDPESHCIELNVIALYCNTTLAVDGLPGELKLTGYHRACTNAVVLGSIPGISTNSAWEHGIVLDRNYFDQWSTINPPVQLYGMVGAVEIASSWFDTIPGASPPAIVKSYSAAGDASQIIWRDNVIGTLTQAVCPYESSTGARLAEVSEWQDRYLNHSLGLYNQANLGLDSMGGSGYLLDAMDASFNGPIARFGFASQGDPSFTEFGGGLEIRYAPETGRGTVQTTNADLRVQSGQLIVTDAATTLMDLNILGQLTVNSAPGLTTTIPFVAPNGTTNVLSFVNGILIGVVQQ